MSGYHCFFPLIHFTRGAIEGLMAYDLEEFRNHSEEFDDAFSSVAGTWTAFVFHDIEEETPLNTPNEYEAERMDELTYYGRYTVRFTFEDINDALIFRLKAP